MDILKAIGYAVSITAIMVGSMFAFAHIIGWFFARPGLALAAAVVVVVAAIVKHYAIGAQTHLHLPFVHAH